MRDAEVLKYDFCRDISGEGVTSRAREQVINVGRTGGESGTAFEILGSIAKNSECRVKA